MGGERLLGLGEDGTARGPVRRWSRYLDPVCLPSGPSALLEENVKHTHPADPGLQPGELPGRAEAAVEEEGTELDPAVSGEAAIRDGLLFQEACLAERARRLERRQIDLYGSMPHGIGYVSDEPMSTHVPSARYGHGETGSCPRFGRRDGIPLVAGRERGASGVPYRQPAEDPSADNSDRPQPNG